MRIPTVSVLVFLFSTSSVCHGWTATTAARNQVAQKQCTALKAASSDVNGDNASTTSASASSINPLLTQIKPSKTVEIFSLVKQMEAEGTKVTSLCVGEPDFLPPQAVLDATTHAIKTGDTRYTAVTGTAPLREAIASDLKRRKGIDYDPMTDIVVGNGAKQCVYQGILATCGQGDTVIVPAPFWPSYPEMVRLVGANPVILETQACDGFLITPERLRNTLEEHAYTAKLLILCNPSNPTGGVHDAQRLEQISEVLKDYPQVMVLADEIYERLVYTKDPCPTFGALPHMFDRTLTVNGFSKAYAMTGMRLGYIAAPTPIAKAVTTIQSQLTSCAGSISQAAGLAALTQVSDEELDANVLQMKEKRDYVLGRLSKMPHVDIEMPPDGAFYVLPDISNYFDGDDTSFCVELLRQKQLAIVPGSSFGAPGTVRLSYATSLEELDVAMTKLNEFLKEQL